MDDRLLALTDALIADIKSTDAYQNLIASHKIIENDPTIVNLSKTFQSAKTAYEKAKQYGSHHPSLKAKTTAYQEAKKALFEHPDVMRYQEASKALDGLLRNVSKALANAVSKHIKTPSPLGVFTEGGSKTCSTEKV